MSKQQHPNQQLIQFMIRAQQIALKDAAVEQGYAMMVVSIVSILMFSMLAACLTITNLSKLSTDASIDGNNSFYVAESGLNQRANSLREMFDNYVTPSGLSPGQATANSPVTLANIANCFSQPITTAASVVGSDFECRNYSFRYNNNAAQTRDRNGNIVLGEQDNNRNSSSYIAHTFVADRTKYRSGNPLLGPEPTKIPSGQAFAGLNAQEHTYTVYSTAKKPNAVNASAAASFTPAEIDAKNRSTKIAGDDTLVAQYDAKVAATNGTNAGQAANDSTINTVLQMDFKVRAIPLFQFGAFYNNDLEISPFSRMDFYGRIHTNKTLTINSNDPSVTNPGLYFAGYNAGTTGDQLNYAITAVNDIYTKDLANNGGNGVNYIVMPGGSENITLSDGRTVTANKLANNKDTPLTNSATAPADYKLDNFSPYLLNYLSSTPIQELTLPPLGFLRKTDSTGAIGDYYGKADLRLTMRFDRAIPFDLTTIKTGTSTGSSCPTSLDIPADRAGKSTAECSTLSKGKLQSLMQPVLVLAKDNTNERDRFCKQSIPVRQTDSTIAASDLNSINNVTVNATLNGLNNQNKDKILRALQVAIAAANLRVSYENVTKAGVLPSSVQTTFKNLLDRLKAANPSDSSLQTALSNTTNIAALAPASIAAIRLGCFLPAPIQSLDNPTTYDLREDRNMKLLQANIESMSVWNRDGVYVNSDTDLTIIPSTATTTDINAAFDDVITTTPITYSTNNLLFTRAEISASATSSYQKLGYGSLPAKSLQQLGFGAVDRTEGGLVLHATLDDTDFPIDPADNKRKYGTSSTNNYLKSQSPFGLVVTGGSNLPGPLTIASDQPIYTQGNYNTFEFVNITNIGAKQPAAILADMITVLSNSCMSSGIGTSISGDGGKTDTFPRGQVNCLFNDTRAATASSTDQSRKATPTNVYAAFANNNEASCGNLGSHVDAAYCTDRNARSNIATTFRSVKSPYFGGGFHNYIRMVEQWKTATGIKVPFVYRGSMVNLGLPQEFNGLAVWEKVYDMPNRDFGFDPLFNSFDKLPPLTPRVIYVKQDVFKRSY